MRKEQRVEYLKQQIKMHQEKEKIAQNISYAAGKFFTYQQNYMEDKTQELLSNRLKELDAAIEKVNSEIKELPRSQSNVGPKDQEVESKKKSLSGEIASREEEVEQLYELRKVKEAQCIKTIQDCEKEKDRLRLEINEITSNLKQEPERLVGEYNKIRSPINQRQKSDAEKFDKERGEICSKWKRIVEEQTKEYYSQKQSEDQRYDIEKKNLQGEFAETMKTKQKDFDHATTRMWEIINTTNNLYRAEVWERQNAKVDTFNSSQQGIYVRYNEEDKNLVTSRTEKTKLSHNQYNGKFSSAVNNFNTHNRNNLDNYNNDKAGHCKQYEEELEKLRIEVTTKLAELRQNANKL